MVNQQRLRGSKAAQSYDTSVNSAWYASVVSAALVFHLGGFTLLLIRLPGAGGWSVLGEALYFDSLQALGFVGVGAICRILNLAVLRRSPSSAFRVVMGDVSVVLLAAVVVAAIAIPFDTSGAALLGILMNLIWGLPAAGWLSALSIVVERYSWLRVLLIAALLLDAVLLLVGLAFLLTP